LIIFQHWHLPIIVRCKRYLYHLQFVFNLNTTFLGKTTLFDKKDNFMENIKSVLLSYFSTFWSAKYGCMWTIIYFIYNLLSLHSLIWNSK